MEVVLSRPLRTGNQNLLPLHEMLVAGGDERLRRDPNTELNRYGCPVLPDSGLIALGSSTASPISEPAYLASKLLHLRFQASLRKESAELVYARESTLIRRELLSLCRLGDLSGLELQLAASGTDAHQAAARRVANSVGKPVHTLTVEEAETGSYVVAAMSSPANQVSTIALRLADGTPRSASEIDADFARHAEQVIAAGRHLLLVMVDVSKTGLLAPSPTLAAELHQRWPQQCDVLVDACQFRFSPATLRCYLELDFMVAITGSKFIGGPSFSGALLIPETSAARLKATTAEPESPNFGLLLRWQAALEEFRAFSQLPRSSVSRVLSMFATAMESRLKSSPLCVAFPVPKLERPFLIESDDWGLIQSIFPFSLRHPKSGSAFTLDETRLVYQMLQRDLGDQSPHAKTRFLVGQPVAYGCRDGTSLGALRICASTRMIVEAAADTNHAGRIINASLAAFDKVEYLAASTRFDRNKI